MAKEEFDKIGFKDDVDAGELLKRAEEDRKRREEKQKRGYIAGVRRPMN